LAGGSTIIDLIPLIANINLEIELLELQIKLFEKGLKKCTSKKRRKLLEMHMRDLRLEIVRVPLAYAKDTAGTIGMNLSGALACSGVKGLDKVSLK